MSEYDELFRELITAANERQLYGDLDSGRLSPRVERAAEKAYSAAAEQTRREISQGADPQSGLHGLPYIPWDERIDGVVAMMGTVSSAAEVEYRIKSQFQRSGASSGDGLFTCLLALATLTIIGLIVLGLSASL